LSYSSPAPFDGSRTLGEALLEQTRIYVKAVLKAIRSQHVKALAHITGGGLLENIPRVLPQGLGAKIDGKDWVVPPVFRWLSRSGALDALEMARTFNCGIGMAVVVAAAHKDMVTKILVDSGETVFRIGEIEKNSGVDRVILNGVDMDWPC
jgi:phosphoribosylformylglycinamidine cyclo-ligase